jgi:hypothetical protein
MLALKMSLDAEPGPVVELVDQGLPRGARLQAERVAAQVHLFTVAVRRNQKLAAKRRKRVGRVARRCIGRKVRRAVHRGQRGFQ